jgi:hypothetical protein
MFKTEQIPGQNNKNQQKALVLKSGTTLANSKIVRSSITHKEITMLLGILVAAIVLFTLWMRTPSQTNTAGNTPSAATFQIVPGNIHLPSAKTIIETTAEILF